jgi:predicted nucleotidyltransferase
VGAFNETGTPYMIIGALAVAVRGHPRFTRDIDAAVDMEPEKVPVLLKALGGGWKSGFRNPVRFAEEHRILHLVGPQRMTADLVLSTHPVEREAISRATPETVRGLEVRVCSLEDLLLLKIGAHRTQDLEDIKALLAVAGGSLDRKRLDARVRDLARDLADEDVFELWAGLFPSGRKARNHR